jgi:hypothetical protein
MTKNDITPKDSACPVFLEPVDEAQLAADQLERQERAAQKEAQLAAKLSAEVKLAALGLTADEIAALKL